MRAKTPVLVAGLLLLLLTSSAHAETAPAEALAPAVEASKREPLLDFEVGHRHAFASRSVSHDAVVGRVELRFAPKVSVALSGAYFAHFDQSYGASPAAFPLTRTFGSIDAAMKFFPLGGHRRDLDLYFLGGLGSIWTKPVSLVDPAHRRFEFEGRAQTTYRHAGTTAKRSVAAVRSALGARPRPPSADRATRRSATRAHDARRARQHLPPRRAS